MDAKRIPKKKKVEIAEEVAININEMPQTNLVANGIKLYDTSRHYINKNTAPSSSAYSSAKAPSPYSPLVTTPRQDILPTNNKSKGQPNGKDVSTGHKRNANGEPIWVQDLKNSIEKNIVLQQCSRSIIDINNEDPIFKWGSFYNFTPIATIDSEAVQTSISTSTAVIDKSTKPSKKPSKASSTRSKSKSDLTVPSSTSNTNSDSSQSYINTTNTISFNMYSIYDKDGNELPELIETNGYLRNVISFATGQPPPATTGDAPDLDKVTITPYNMHRALHWWGVKSDPMLLAAITDREQQRQRVEAERLAAIRQQELLIQQQELTLMKYEDDHMMAILYEEFKQEQAELARRRAEEEEENNWQWAAQQQMNTRLPSLSRQHYSQHQSYQPYQQMPRGPRPAAPYYKASSGFPRGQPAYVQPEYGYAPSSSHPTFPQPRHARYAPPVNGGQRSNYASHFTAPSTPVVAVMVPRGPRGPRGYPFLQPPYTSSYQQSGRQQPQYDEPTQQPYYKDRNSADYSAQQATNSNYGGYGSASTSQGHNYGQRVSQSSYSNKYAQPIHGGNYRTSNGQNYDSLSSQLYQGESAQSGGGGGKEWNLSDVATGQIFDSYQSSTQPSYGVYSSGADAGTYYVNSLNHSYNDHTESKIPPADHPTSAKVKSHSTDHPTRQRDVYTDVQPKVKPTSDQSTIPTYNTTHQHDTADIHTYTLPVPESSHKDRSEHEEKGGGEHKERSGDKESREYKHSKKDRDHDRDRDRDRDRDKDGDREGKDHKRHRHSSHSGDDEKKRSKESKYDKEPKEGKHRHREHKSHKSSSSSSHRHRSCGHKPSSGHNSDTSAHEGGPEK